MFNVVPNEATNAVERARQSARCRLPDGLAVISLVLRICDASCSPPIPPMSSPQKLDAGDAGVDVIAIPGVPGLTLRGLNPRTAHARACADNAAGLSNRVLVRKLCKGVI